jgi:hypothetical protein
MNGWGTVFTPTVMRLLSKYRSHVSGGENYGVYCGKKQGEDAMGGVISQINLYERVGEQTSEFSREKSIIVELITDKGALDLIIYCEHNGYYAHDYYIRIGAQVVNGRI